MSYLRPAPARLESVDSPAASKAYNWFTLFLLFVLAGYALFDRGFAWIHPPGTPLFWGEVLLLLGLATVLAGTPHVRRSLRLSGPLGLLCVFAVWGVLRTVPFLTTYGRDSVRDGALWYYSLLAVFVAALLHARPELIVRITDKYGAFVPWLLVWSPFAVVLGRLEGGNFGPTLPGSGVPILSHKSGNVASHAVLAVAFLWLVPNRWSRRARFVLTGIALAVIAVAGTQNRGGLVAAVIAMLMVWVFSRDRVRMAATVMAVLIPLVLVGWAFNLRLQVTGERELSVSQLSDNVRSVLGAEEDESQLQGTVEWRNDLWATVTRATFREEKGISGWGFGRNLALDLGFSYYGTGMQLLRSPHNSHVDVFARMGLVGLGLWVALWLSWYWALLKARDFWRASADPLRRGLTEALLVSASAMLVNAYFDPTLESPQAALWLWTIFGLGAALAVDARLHRRRFHVRTLGNSLGRGPASAHS